MESKKYTTKIYAAALGAGAGTLSGMLGAGGGIVITLLLPLIFPNEFLNAKDIFANSLCILLPLSAVAAVRYAVGGSVDFTDVAALAVPALLGGLAGGFATLKLKPSAIRAVFGLLTLWSGVYLIFR